MADQTMHTKNVHDSRKTTIQVGSGTRHAEKSSFALPKKVVLLFFVGLFGILGAYMLFRSRAGSLPDGSIFAGNYIIDAGGVKTTPQRFPASVEKSSTGLRGAVPTMSFDGKKIAYYDMNTQKVKIIDATTTLQVSEFLPATKRMIQSVSYMQWNADATKLAVQYQVDAGIMRGFVMNADGTDVLDVPEAWNIAIAGWLPDSSGLVYVKDYAELCTLSVSSKAEQCSKLQGYESFEKTGGTLRARIAPNGSTVAVVYKKRLEIGNQTKLFTTTVSGGVLQETFEVPAEHDISAIAWSPDSEKLAYARQGLREGQGTELRVYNTATKTDVALTPGGKGTAITQLDWVIRDEDRVVAPADLAPSAPKVVTGVVPRGLSSLAQNIQSERLVLSPGATQAVFAVPKTNPAQATRLQSVDIATGEVKDFVTLPDVTANWALDSASPDGQWLALHKVTALDQKQNAQENWLMKPDGSNLKLVSRQVIGASQVGYSLVWRADSTGFHYVVPSVAGSKPQLCTQDTVGENRQCVEVVDSTNAVANAQNILYGVAKDGTSFVLIAVGANESKLYRVDVGTGATTLLQTLPATRVQHFSWAPDGTKLGVTLTGQSGSGIYTMAPDGTSLAQVSPVVEAFVWAPPK